MSIEAAFREICTDMVEPENVWLTLYLRCPFYGGPEEGGWWGEDVMLIASQQFGFESDAEFAKAKVETLAKKLTDQAKRDHGDQCRRECDWLDERGLDDDFLPEVSGADSYFVKVETERGVNKGYGERHWS